MGWIEIILIIGFILLTYNLYGINEKLDYISKVVFTIKEIQNDVHMPEIRARERADDD
jgi:hypothetical protein